MQELMKTLCAIIPAAIIGSFKKDHVPDDFSALGRVTCHPAICHWLDFRSRLKNRKRAWLYRCSLGTNG